MPPGEGPGGRTSLAWRLLRVFEGNDTRQPPQINMQRRQMPIQLKTCRIADLSIHPPFREVVEARVLHDQLSEPGSPNWILPRPEPEAQVIDE